MHPGQAQAWLSRKRIVAIISAGRSGKALALDTPIPTPAGFVSMGELKADDMVFDRHGRPCRIEYVSPVMLGNACYRVQFDDGCSVVADAEHLWVTQTVKQRGNASRRRTMSNWPHAPAFSILATEEIAGSLFDVRGETNHSICQPEPFQTADADLPVPPYTLGAWLGDGTSSCANITVMDAEILDGLRADGMHVAPRNCSNAGQAQTYLIDKRGGRGGSIQQRDATLQGKLRKLGVLHNKHIPAVYLFASPAQRLALLQGLMDTDGYCHGSCEIMSVKPRLAADVVMLLRGLGIKAHVTTKIPTINGLPCRMAYRICFTTMLPVFRLSRKAARLPKETKSDVRRRFITAVDPVASVPVRCIGVDSPSRQYLCGEGFIPTHNTSFGPLWLHEEMRQKGPGDYLIAAPNYPLLDKAAVPEVENLFCRLLNLAVIRRSKGIELTITEAGEQAFKDSQAPGWLAGTRPTRVLFAHADDPETLEAMSAKAAWLDEAGQSRFKLQSWEAIQQRLSVDRGRCLITTKPYTFGWLKQKIYDPWKASNGLHPDIDVIEFDSLMNPAFPPEEYERARRELPPWRFQMMYQGKFTRPAGLIYDAFDPIQHVCPRFLIPLHWPRYGGLDFGAVHTAAVFLAGEIGPGGYATGRYFAYRTYHPGRKIGGGSRTALEHVQALRAGEPDLLQFAGGSAVEEQWRSEFGAAGLYVRDPQVRDVEVGIERVNTLIRAARLIVFSDCYDLLDELQSYSRETDELGRSTEKIADKDEFHCADALRYCCIILAGGPGGDVETGRSADATDVRVPADVWFTGGALDRGEDEEDDAEEAGGAPLWPVNW